MEYRTLEINVISAKGLKKVNLITKMDVYVFVSISGGKKQKQKQRTSVDRDGDENPSWNFPMKFALDESVAKQNLLTLKFKIRCDRVLGDKDVGKVRVPVKQLLDSAEEGMKSVSYSVQRSSGKPKGQLTFSFKFGEKVTGAVAMAETKGDQPITAYPAAGPSSGYGVPPAPYPVATSGYPYPPPPPAGGYPPPPRPPPAVAGYGYPAPPPYGGYSAPPPPYGGYSGQPPPPGYGYPPPPVQEAPKKKNKFGMGLGAGLLGGALGGLLIGDMISDSGSYEAGYEDGFGDAGF